MTAFLGLMSKYLRCIPKSSIDGVWIFCLFLFSNVLYVHKPCSHHTVAEYFRRARAGVWWQRCVGNSLLSFLFLSSRSKPYRIGRYIRITEMRESFPYFECVELWRVKLVYVCLSKQYHWMKRSCHRLTKVGMLVLSLVLTESKSSECSEWELGLEFETLLG